MRSKTRIQAAFEAAGVVIGGFLGSAAIYWALAAQDDPAVLIGAMVVGAVLPLAGGAAGEAAYKAARNDR